VRQPRFFKNCRATEKRKIRFSSSSASPIVNGLSDHDAQYLMITNIAAAGSLIPLKQRTRKVNN
jgi:hypothetical protein